ncbi:ribonucleoside-diphosphate reductase subunit alpha [bacterium]|nr:ribonucleoside-diphosphate reductase subunit alpha [bacterium]
MTITPEIHAKDLSNVDLSLVENDIKIINNLGSDDDKYKYLINLCKGQILVHPDWGILAGRIRMEQLKSKVSKTFSNSTKIIEKFLNKNYFDFVMKNSSKLNLMIDESLDWKFDLFAVETMIKSYLAKGPDLQPIETPQYMYLRVATFMWYPDFKKIEKTYKSLSLGEYAHASPTLFNSGFLKHQLASCFLMGIDDSLDSVRNSIADSWRKSAVISACCGGLGITFGNLRHSEINQGVTRGIFPWLKITNEVLNAVDQGGKRKGSATVYLETWHIDIEDFVEMKRPGGSEDMRARDLFYALWISDLFMRRVEADQEWILFCPKKAPGLTTTWGLDFEKKYKEYERKVRVYLENKKNSEIYFQYKKELKNDPKNVDLKYFAHKYSNYPQLAKDTYMSGFKIIKARDLWHKVLISQFETGGPFCLYKDACNRKSNQQNLGTIQCSNLCTEIVEYTDKDNIASCNLASIVLCNCVVNSTDGKPRFDFDKLMKITSDLVNNLNQVIDRNYYPKSIPEIKGCNFRNRPLGIGVQGLADTFELMDISWESEDASKLNYQIFEAIYYAAVKESVKISKEKGAYETFEGSPASKGLFQFDLWDLEKMNLSEKVFKSEKIDENTLKILKLHQLKNQVEKFSEDVKFDWKTLRQDMVIYGLRNSLLLAVMPTASTAHMLGNRECIEPPILIENRTVLSGQFLVIDRHLVRDLEKHNLWETDIVKNILKNNGSVQNLPGNSDIIKWIKQKYKTAYELPQKVLMKLSVERGRFICQSQSHNCWMDPAGGTGDPKTKLNAYHFYAWKNGAKTGMYYLRTKAVVNPIDFTSSDFKIEKKNNIVCKREAGCISCQ